uniref:Immunoglobulin domain-containing protein n=1 Tax=Calidris pygmaea TaxID=425635 RepID=A0A8C3PU36_9CHAR
MYQIESPVFGPEQVYGLLKGSVTVKCFYPPTSVNRHDRKYWCKQSATGCTTIVSTSGYTAPGFQGRVSIIDYPLAKSFQINMTELTEADEGTYQCGIGINGRGLSHKVDLDVSEGNYNNQMVSSRLNSLNLKMRDVERRRPALLLVKGKGLTDLLGLIPGSARTVAYHLHP